MKHPSRARTCSPWHPAGVLAMTGQARGVLCAPEIITSFTVPLVLPAAGTAIGGLPAVSAQVTTGVVAWEDNSAGELGGGSLTQSTTPGAVGAREGSRPSLPAAATRSPCAQTARSPPGTMTPRASWAPAPPAPTMTRRTRS